MLSLIHAGDCVGCLVFEALAAEVIDALEGFRLHDAVQVAKRAIDRCERAIGKARQSSRTVAANHARLLALYFRCLEEAASFWSCSLENDFRTAWDHLVSAERLICTLHANAVDVSEVGLLDLAVQLDLIQRLFPYRIFSSIEMLSLAESCTICGLCPWDEKCLHRTGEIVDGRIAQIEVTEARFIGLALTSRPKDKRCVILPDGVEPDYEAVADLTRHAPSPLLRLRLVEEVHILKRRAVAAKADDLCPCGEEKRFSRCHGSAAEVPVLRRNLVPDGTIRLIPPRRKLDPLVHRA